VHKPATVVSRTQLTALATIDGFFVVPGNVRRTVGLRRVGEATE